MNIEGFIAEYKNDPLGRGYSGMTDQQLWDSLQTVDRTSRVPVACIDIKKHALENGYWPNLVMARRDVNTPAQVLVPIISALDWIDDPGNKTATLDFDNPKVVEMLAGLVATGMMTQVQADNLNALADVYISRAEEIQCGDMTYEYMSYLRQINA